MFLPHAVANDHKVSDPGSPSAASAPAQQPNSPTAQQPLLVCGFTADQWLVIALLLVGSAATLNAAGQYVVPNLAPRLVVQSPEFDFGTRYVGETVQHDFTLTNAGWFTLKINRMVAACSCSVAKLPTQEIAPGKSIPLSVTLSLRGPTEAERKSVSVYTSEASAPPAVVVLSGKVRPNYEFFTAQNQPSISSGERANPQKPVKTISLTAASETGTGTEANTEAAPSGESRRVVCRCAQPFVIQSTAIIGSGARVEQVTSGSATEHELLITAVPIPASKLPQPTTVKPETDKSTAKHLATPRGATLLIRTDLQREPEARLPITFRTADEKPAEEKPKDVKDDRVVGTP